MEEVRTFIAIELPDELKAELTRLQAALKLERSPSVKWVNPDSLHLTLKFLGNVSIDKLDEITLALEVAAEGIPPFRLEARELGVFPNLNRVQVVWVGLVGEAAKLAQLQQSIESELAQLGFAAELRPFTAHLTLARIRSGASLEERQRLGQRIINTRFEATCPIEVKSISLMKSQLTREGAIYSRLSSVGLKPLSTSAS